jgi:hypothetical protein
MRKHTHPPPCWYHMRYSLLGVAALGASCGCGILSPPHSAAPTPHHSTSTLPLLPHRMDSGDVGGMPLQLMLLLLLLLLLLPHPHLRMCAPWLHCSPDLASSAPTPIPTHAGCSRYQRSAAHCRHARCMCEAHLLLHMMSMSHCIKARCAPHHACACMPCIYVPSLCFACCCSFFGPFWGALDSASLPVPRRAPGSNIVCILPCTAVAAAALCAAANYGVPYCGVVGVEWLKAGRQAGWLKELVHLSSTTACACLPYVVYICSIKCACLCACFVCPCANGR